MQESILISKATKKNWDRLGVEPKELLSKLSKRANKRYSTKKILPVEYYTNPNTEQSLEKILELSTDIDSTIYTLAINLLTQYKLINLEKNPISDNEYIIEILNNYTNKNINQNLLELEIPKERDFLGIVYQSLMLEGSKNIKGSYYTPYKIVKKSTHNIKCTDKFLDPCCGTGSFLLAVCEKITDPNNIFGCDLDKTACFIAKINLIIQFKNKKFRPNIFNCDFLLDKPFDITFDIIATNPPWGAITKQEYKNLFSQIKSDEIFSYFIVQSTTLVKKEGQLTFILPESILNVKTHQDIRKFILDNLSVNEIVLHNRAFSGVLTNVVTLNLKKQSAQNNQIKISANKIMTLSQKYYEKNPYNKFSIMDNKDVEIIEKIYSVPHITLKDNSKWGLGIVTGNNEKHISKISQNMLNPKKIYSGKNIKKNEIIDSDLFIDYQRDNFQQVAPDCIYNAKEKLVYKFISKKLIFAYDDKQRLFLNSANVLIPKISNYSVKNVMTFLNSTVFQYIYTKRFNELKILKNNLMELPFPKLSAQELEDLTDDKIFQIFNLSGEEILYIKSLL
ncbi:MAG: hypothetical protein E7Z87_05685 [Cyanobacteria bacterium SIG26]|nr:hypothetical protein [Cyanobacteria bacterium SIG26]